MISPPYSLSLVPDLDFLIYLIESLPFDGDASSGFPRPTPSAVVAFGRARRSEAPRRGFLGAAWDTGWAKKISIKLLS